MKLIRHATSILGLAALTLSSTLFAEARPSAVEVATAEIRTLSPSIQASGQVQSKAAADLAAGMNGRIEWVAEPGTFVEANQMIARIDTSELKLQRAEQAARNSRAKVNTANLLRELERLKASGNAVSRFQLDQAQAQFELAKADEKTLALQLQQTDEQLNRAVVRSPFSGVVLQRNRRIGEEVQRGEILVRLVNPDDLEIRLFVPLRHVRAVQPGNTVKVVSDKQTFEARVRSVVPAGDARSQSFEVLVGVPAVAGLVTAGSVVNVELPLGAPTEMLAIPRDALIIRGDGIFAYRVTDDNKAERVAIKLGVADGDWISISEGLQVQDKVIIRGAESLRGNETVNIVGAR